VSKLPHLGTSSGNASAYGTVTKVTVGLLVFELAVRYPLTVFAEESFFRGYLQPRLPWAPPILSGVLWAGFHLQQANTIASLVPLGIALGTIRWWTGNVRTTAAIHYGLNAAFFLTNYR
jgi:membrane protease YdiL (CAAX protease family)